MRWLAPVALLIATMAALVTDRPAEGGVSCLTGLDSRLHSYHWETNDPPAYVVAQDVVTTPAISVRDYYGGGNLAGIAIGHLRYQPQPSGVWLVGRTNQAPSSQADWWHGFQVRHEEVAASGSCHVSGSSHGMPAQIWLGRDGLPTQVVITFPPPVKEGPSGPVTYRYSSVNRVAPIVAPPASQTWHGGYDLGAVGQRLTTVDGGVLTVRGATLTSNSPAAALPNAGLGYRYLVVDLEVGNTGSRTIHYTLGLELDDSPIVLASGMSGAGDLNPGAAQAGRLIFRVRDTGGEEMLKAVLGLANLSVVLTQTNEVAETGVIGQPITVHDVVVTVTRVEFDVHRIGFPPRPGSRIVVVHFAEHLVTGGPAFTGGWVIDADGKPFRSYGGMLETTTGDIYVQFYVPAAAVHLTLKGEVGIGSVTVPLS